MLFASLLLWTATATAEWRWSDVFMPGTLLPLFGNHPKVRQSLDGAELPPAYGVTPGYFRQRLGSDFSSLYFDPPQIGGEGGLQAPLGSGPWLDPLLRPATGARSAYQQTNLRLDAWLLPMLNVFYMVGDGSGRTLVDGEVAGEPVEDLFEYRYSVRSTARGLSLVYGQGPWWGALSGVHSKVRGHAAGQLDFALEPRLLALRLGWAAPQGPGLWLGAAHMHMGGIRGRLRDLDWLRQTDGLRDAGLVRELLAAGSAPVDVGFSGTMQARAHWSYILGLGWQFSRSFNLQMELGADADGGRIGMLDLQWRPRLGA